LFGDGGRDPGEALRRFLAVRRVRRIDLVVVSHPHPDHYGGLAALVGKVEIGEVWVSGDDAGDARWDALRARYLGRDRAVEKRRPLFAAEELYAAAIRHAGLDPDNQVRPKVEKIARRHDVPVETAEVKASVTDPKAALKAFAGKPLADLACFELTLDRLEADLQQMAARANAWSIGDLDTMRRLPYTDQGQACLSAVLDTELARSQGLDALPAQVRDAWLAAAEKALATHKTSFALLPMAEILKPDGYLAALGARGYAIEAPSDDAAP
jgi:hypothetical protein